MDLLQALWLGLVQGLTEFLPVSSSGHLVLLQRIFGIGAGNASEFLVILLHVGSLLAVFVVFWKRILNMILHPIKSELKWLLLASIPAAVAAFLLRGYFDDAFKGEYLGFSFLLTTLILWLADLVSGVSFETKQVRWYNALVMGVMQAVAILPGVSRSGATISGGIATGLSRKRAADFAFLMSIPAILGGLLVDLIEVYKGDISIAGLELMPVLVGVVAAAVSGFLAIKFMLVIVRRVRLPWFGLYTGLLGVLILLDQYIFHLYF